MTKWNNYALNTTKQGVRSTASRGLSRLFSFVLTGLLALCLGSCKSKQTVTTQSTRTQSDSLSQRSSFQTSNLLQSVATIEMQQVAADTTTMSLPMTSLLDLPDSAVFRRQSGRLVIEAYRRAGNIYIRGTTQPIGREVKQQLVTTQTKTANASNTQRAATRSEQHHSHTKVVKPPSAYLIGVLTFLALALLVGIASYTIIKYIRKWKQQ